jgi:hypothetical protein
VYIIKYNLNVFLCLNLKSGKSAKENIMTTAIAFTSQKNVKMIAIEKGLAVGLGLHKDKSWRFVKDNLPEMPKGIVKGSYYVAAAEDVVVLFKEGKTFLDYVATRYHGQGVEEAEKADSPLSLGRIDVRLIGLDYIPESAVTDRMNAICSKFAALGLFGVRMDSYRFQTEGLNVYGLDGHKTFNSVSWDGSQLMSKVLSDLDELEARLDRVSDLKNQAMILLEKIDYRYLNVSEIGFSMNLVKDNTWVECPWDCLKDIKILNKACEHSFTYNEWVKKKAA